MTSQSDTPTQPEDEPWARFDEIVKVLVNEPLEKTRQHLDNAKKELSVALHGGLANTGDAVDGVQRAVTSVKALLMDMSKSAEQRDENLRGLLSGLRDDLAQARAALMETAEQNTKSAEKSMDLMRSTLEQGSQARATAEAESALALARISNELSSLTVAFAEAQATAAERAHRAERIELIRFIVLVAAILACAAIALTR